VGTEWYSLLDNLDGRQARRTGTSSPLGELFDHGCDCLAVAVCMRHAPAQVKPTRSNGGGRRWGRVRPRVSTNLAPCTRCSSSSPCPLPFGWPPGKSMSVLLPSGSFFTRLRLMWRGQVPHGHLFPRLLQRPNGRAQDPALLLLVDGACWYLSLPFAAGKQ
jgi:hypothetical protein